MDSIYEDFFHELLTNADHLSAYVDSLYSDDTYSEDDLNHIFGVLKKEDLVSCVYADNRAWIHNITFKGKHYFDDKPKISVDKPRLLELIDAIDNVEKCFHKSSGLGFSKVEVIYDIQDFQDWIQELQHELQHLLKSPSDKFIEDTLTLVSKSFNGWDDKKTFSEIKSKLSVIKKRYFINSNTINGETNIMKNKIFIVHGHDDAAKESVARVVQTLGYEPIILHEQASTGKTIIEKIEKYTDDIAFAIILYTECDKGRDKNQGIADEQYRARQNVVFEHGLLIGKLKRDHVIAFVKGDVEVPGDIDGVVYTKMDTANAWKYELVKNMKAIGLVASADRLL